MKFNLGLLSKWRCELMGLAAMLIIICHMPANGVVMPSIISKVIQYGGLGCDVFLLLSGMGMANSLAKNTIGGGNIIRWFRKRYVRILVPYLLIALPCLAIPLIDGNISISEFILRVTTLSYWTDGWGLWFIAMLLPLYLITPLLITLLTNKNRWIWLVALTITTWFFSAFLLGDGPIRQIQFVVSRMPSYFLGIALYDTIKIEKRVSIAWVTLFPVALIVIALLVRWYTPLYLSLFWVQGIPLIAALTILLEKCKLSSIHKVTAFMGAISLESYCTNVFALGYFKNLPWDICDINLNPGNWSFYIVGTIGCIILSKAVHCVSKIIFKK